MNAHRRTILLILFFISNSCLFSHTFTYTSKELFLKRSDDTSLGQKENLSKQTANDNFVINTSSWNRNDFVTLCTTKANSFSTCHTTDSLNLVQLYNATNGVNWTNVWNLNNPINTWYGVKTNSENCVISIELQNNNLTGNIPEIIGTFSHLQTLYLYNNNLSGGIPKTIGALSMLEKLHLAENELTGNIPTEIQALNNLEQLNLYTNNLTGSIPAIIGALTNLKNISLFNNQLTSAIPTTIGALNNLEILSLNNNQLTGIIPVSFTNLTKLVALQLQNNQLTGSISAQLAQLDSLQFLRLNDNQLSGCFPKSLTKFCNIICHFENNPDLPNEGDFDAFCENGIGVCIEPVWPGDFNNDGIVNQGDLLFWGIACQETQGPERPNASSGWVAQSCPDWETEVEGVNSKHQDGDGNGIINEEDLRILCNNIGQTHFVPSTNVVNSSIADSISYGLKALGLKVVVDENGDSIEALQYELYMKDAVGNPVDIHGLACSIDLGNLPVEAAMFDTTNSALHPTQQLIAFDEAQNTLNVALTRTDKQNQSTDSPLGILLIVITDNIAVGDPILLSVKNGNSMATEGNPNEIKSSFNAVGGTSIYDSYSEVQPSSVNLVVTASVTAEQCKILGTATLDIRGGQSPYVIEWSTGDTTTKITNLIAGNYAVTVTSANGRKRNHTVTIEKNSFFIYENGQLIDCIPASKLASCHQHSLSLPDTIPNGIYQVINSIITKGAISVESDVSLKAGESITLQPGFSAPTGSSFSAIIEACSPNEQANTIACTGVSSLKSPPIQQKNIKIPKVSTLQIMPNPFKAQAVIEYNLSVDEPVYLILSDVRGRRLKVLANATYQTAGKHQVVVNAEGLTKGLYFITLKTKERIETKKILLIE